MLVIVTEEQLLPPQCVCQTCVLADHHGQPRWHQGQLMLWAFAGAINGATSPTIPVSDGVSDRKGRVSPARQRSGWDGFNGIWRAVQWRGRKRLTPSLQTERLNG